MDVSKPTYTQEEVNEILKRALAQEASKERVLDHDDLVDIAQEAGIDRAALERAMAEIAQERVSERARQDMAADLEAERRVQLKRFAASLISYAAFNAVIYFVCLRTGGDWFVWPLLGCAAILALKLRNVIFPYEKIEHRRRKNERERARALRKAEREAFKQKLLGMTVRPTDNAKAFENVVQVGVSALLSIAERKLTEHQRREKARRRDTP